MKGNTLSDEERSQSNQPNSFSLNFNSSWKPTEKDILNESNLKKSTTTFQMQINGDVITMTPDNTCVGARSNGKNPASVARRNARERRRIKNVNSAFDELRQHVPHGERSRKKISKVDTLQSAIEYIKALEELVRSRREESSQIDEYSTDKENIREQTSNDSPVSSTFTDSENEDMDSNIRAIRNDEDEMKHTRSSEITESMRKAFDIMLHKNSIKQNSTPKSIPHKQPCQNTNLPTSSIRLVCEEEIAKDFPELAVDENHSVYLASTDSSYNLDTNANHFISNQSKGLKEYSESVESVSSSLPQTARNNVTPFNGVPLYLTKLHGLENESNDPSNNPLLERTANPCVFPRFAQTLPIQDVAENEATDWSSDATTSQSDQWSNSPNSNVIENPDDLLGIHSSFVPMAIDQISPSIDFLPPDDEDYSHYTNLFSPEGHPSLDQHHTSFSNQATENSWVLAQLN